MQRGPKTKYGRERFHTRGVPCGIALIEYWQWAVASFPKRGRTRVRSVAVTTRRPTSQRRNAPARGTRRRDRGLHRPGAHRPRTSRPRRGRARRRRTRHGRRGADAVRAHRRGREIALTAVPVQRRRSGERQTRPGAQPNPRLTGLAGHPTARLPGRFTSPRKPMWSYTYDLLW